MQLSVQLAARRLGVSPHTIRRWTASGFLPCTRTAGGHRRIKQEDVDELAHLIGGRNHLAARLERERELEALVAAATAGSRRTDSAASLREIAGQLTRLLDAHLCVVSVVDPETGGLSMRAVYDDRGGRRHDPPRHALGPSPATRHAMETHECVIVNVTDPHADPAEVAVMRRNGDQSLLILPLLYQDEIVGVIEVLDHQRERTYGRHELRLAGAVAALVAVALHDAAASARLARMERVARELHSAVGVVSAGRRELREQRDIAGLLRTAAEVAARALDAISCVASYGGESAGASGLAARDAPAPDGAAHVLYSAAPCGGDEVRLTVTVGSGPGEGRTELLELVAAMAADAVGALRTS